MALKKHNARVHHKQINFRCKYCPKQSYYKEDHDNHVLFKHENRDSFKCELCPKKYAFSIVLKDHVKRIHSASYDFPCDICDSKFKVQRVLQKHKKDQHNQAREEFTCKVCSKQVIGKSNLLLHHKTHMEKIKCDECNKLIAYSNMQRHIRIKHSQTSSQQMHSCNVCNKTLKSSISLKSHILNHHTSRPSTTKGSGQKKNWEKAVRKM